MTQTPFHFDTQHKGGGNSEKWKPEMGLQLYIVF